MFDAHTYTITLKGVSVDGEELFRAKVAELLDVEVYGSCFQHAYEIAIDAIETLYCVFEEEGRAFPDPTDS